MRKLEKLDAEKHARRSDVSYCGIDAWKIEEIPFGVRAIQRGVEVDGIWISRSDVDVASQVASSATLVSHAFDHGRQKDKVFSRGVPYTRGSRSVSEFTSSASET